MTLDAFPQTRGPSEMDFWYQGHDFKAESPFSGHAQRSFQWGLWRARFSYTDIEQGDGKALRAFLNAHRTDTPFTLYDPSMPHPDGAARNSQGVVENDQVVGAGSSGDIRFTASTKTIQKTGGGLSVFSLGQQLKITGAAQSGNNKTVTVTGVTSTLITVAETLVDENSSTATIKGYQTGTTLKTSGWPQTNGTVLFQPGDIFGLSSGLVFEITAQVTVSGGLATLHFAQVLGSGMSPEDGDAIVCENVPFTMVCEDYVKPTISSPTIYSLEATFREWRGD